MRTEESARLFYLESGGSPLLQQGGAGLQSSGRASQPLGMGFSPGFARPVLKGLIKPELFSAIADSQAIDEGDGLSVLALSPEGTPESSPGRSPGLAMEQVVQSRKGRLKAA